jgi:uncharacterized protein YjbI with pentapeptide repeats
MAHPRRSLSESLRVRWEKLPPSDWDQSPFGSTDEGLADFRGSNLEGETLNDIRLTNVDLSHSKLSKIRVKQSTITNVRFSACDLYESYFSNVSFKHCNFDRSDMRWGGMGIPSVILDECSFDGARIKKRFFEETTFINMIFEGNVWSGTDFRNCHFAECRFSGDLYNVRFRGAGDVHTEFSNYRLDQVNLRGVDFSDAKFSLVDMRANCTFRDIHLPSDQHVFIDTSKNAIDMQHDPQLLHSEREIIRRFVAQTLPDPGRQYWIFVSKISLVGCGDAQAAESLFTKWKLKAEK